MSKLGTMTVCFKSPDGVSDAVETKVNRLMNQRYEAIEEGYDPDNFSLPDDKEFCQDKTEEINEALKKILSYGEVIRIEIDLDTGTAKVLPPRNW